MTLKIYAGLHILLMHEPRGRMDAEHDQIWVDGPPPDKIPADSKELKKLGWFWDEEVDSWSYFV